MAGLSCGSRFAKYFLFLFNVIFWIVGAAILGIGIWVLVDSNSLNLLHIATVDSSDALVRASAGTFVALGAIVFLAGFFGCCGAIRESPCMLITYAWIVGFILLLQIIAGILGVAFKDQILDSLDSSMNKTVNELYGQPDQNATSDAYDFMQRSFSCCGALNGPSDWQESYWYRNQQDKHMTVPLTCCVLSNKNKFNDPPEAVNATLCYLDAGRHLNSSDYVNVNGCRQQLEDWVVGHAALLIGIAFGLAIVQVVGIIIACCLHKQIQNQYEYV